MRCSTLIVLGVIFSANAAFIGGGVNEVLVAEALSSESSCDYQSCDQLCQRYGFTGGACIGDQCKCFNVIHSPAHEKETPMSERSCDYRSCDQLCRRLGFPGGACVGDRCKCDNFLKSPATNDISFDTYFERISREAARAAVDQLNILDQGNPEKYKYTLDTEVNIDKDVPPIEKKLDLDATNQASVLKGSCDCVPYNCNFYCFRLHYIGGVCVTGQCRCYK